MLQVKNLTIQLKKTQEPLVRASSFQIRQGEVLGLIGESGSGKSLTGKSLMQLLNPDIYTVSGEIYWRGNDILTSNCLKRGKQIGIIPQNPMTAFAPMMRIGRQIELGWSFRSKEEREGMYQQLADALLRVNLPDMKKIINSYPDQLSGGTLQRIMIAMTMLQMPELLIADEITTAIDAASEYLILQELEHLKQDGATMLLITHDFGVAARLCDSVAVMKQGEIIETGSIREVFVSPKWEYTQQLVDASVLFQEVLC